jgi:hypothetical protein
MKSRIIPALMVSAFSVAVSAGAQPNTHATAQAATPVKETPSSSNSRAPATSRAEASADSTRNYDSAALRFESRWGSADIKRGADGRVVGTVGWFRDFDVEQLVASSPRAVTEARNFKAENFHGSLAGGVGALTFVTGLVVASNSSNNAASPILIIAGAGGIAWGAQHLQLGYSALTRAFWWYNRDLSR